MVETTRRAVWRDGADNGWHDDLIWFAAAVHRMRELTPGLDDYFGVFADVLQQGLLPQLQAQLASISAQWEDPRSWGYQSQVHGTFTPKPDWPRHQGQRALWRECAHNHWFFLPWHRAYLVEFEFVVRQHIRDLDGPADQWALPYWNYSDWEDDPQRRELPLPLRDEALPPGVQVPGLDDAAPNPLFIPVRSETTDDPDWANAGQTLQRPHFANQEDRARISFGGGVIERPNDEALFHAESREMGQLDARPHGSVHNHVGGAMWLFETAALDPAFWLHHCNVDRLWETFAHDLRHGYPFRNGQGTGTEAHRSWQEQQFDFLRPDGETKTWTAPEVLDVVDLGYAYDSTEPPELGPRLPQIPGADEGAFGFDAPPPEPEPVADAGGPVELAGEREVRLTGGDPEGQELGPDAFPPDARWLLAFDGIRSVGPAVTSYRVYLGPAPAAPVDADDPDHYAGLLTLFGVFEASRDDGSSAGSGAARVLDVTGQVRAQSATLRPLATSVRLIPLDPDRDLERMGLSIDRIALEVV
jgi:tyrosinase